MLNHPLKPANQMIIILVYTKRDTKKQPPATAVTLTNVG
jgi:hypothetical protein